MVAKQGNQQYSRGRHRVSQSISEFIVELSQSVSEFIWWMEVESKMGLELDYGVVNGVGGYT